MIDEDFEEIMREQTQYIEELEAELAEYKHVASAIDTQWAESQDEIADLKDKLAKAVELAEKSIKWLRLYGADVHREAATLAELTGGSDE